MTRTKPTIRLYLFLIVSILFHGGVTCWLSFLPAPDPSEIFAVEVEIEDSMILVAAEANVPLSSSTTALAPLDPEKMAWFSSVMERPREQRRIERRDQQRPKQKPTTDMRSQPTKPPAAKSAVPRPSPLPPGEVLSLSMRRQRLDLQPNWKELSPFLDAPVMPSDTDLAPDQEAVTQTKPPHDTATKNRHLKEKVDGLFADDQADRELKDGRVAPYYYDLRRDMEHRFHLDWSLIENDQSKMGTVGQSMKDFVKGWAKNYVKELQARAERDRRIGKEDDEMTMLDYYKTAAEQAEKDASALNCLYCVTLVFGKKPQLKKVRSSGRLPFDRQAERSVRQAVAARPPPAKSKPVVACYLFRGTFFRFPLLPMAGCSFDESKPAISCYYPTKKLISTTIKLRSVRPLPPGQIK